MSGFPEGTPTTRLTLGGRSHELGFNWGAKKRVRDYLLSQGKSATTTHEEDYLAAAVWASMDKETRGTLTVDDVLEMIGPQNEQEIAGKIKQLIGAAEPEKDAEEETEGELEEKNSQPVAVKAPTTGESQSKSAGQLASTI